MTVSRPSLFPRTARLGVFLVGAGILSACTLPDASHPPEDVFDPYEERNREVHEMNRKVDRALLRPMGRGYGKVIPHEFQYMIGQFATNVSLPGAVANNLLQGNLKGAWEDSTRFAVNTVLGFGGMFDPATDFGLPDATDADFGETLHVWGVPEGAYLELPVIGPSTERDAAGKFVDLFTDPLSYVLGSPEKYFGTAARVASKIGDRGRFSDTVDSVLYESADSYAQARLIYLQNRRFDLGGSRGETYLDPYDTTYTDPYDDPYLIPYEDPYDE